MSYRLPTGRAFATLASDADGVLVMVGGVGSPENAEMRDVLIHREKKWRRAEGYNYRYFIPLFMYTSTDLFSTG